MKISKSILTVLILISCTSLHAEISPEKRTEIENMLKLTGTIKMVDQMMSQMIAGMSANMKNVPPGFWDKFKSKVNASELVEKIIPIYDKYYTIDDLRAVNAFYSSAVGQRILSTTPQVMQESMVVGQEWGQNIGKRAAEDAMAEIKLKESNPTP